MTVDEAKLREILQAQFEAFETRFEAKMDDKLTYMEFRLEAKLESKLNTKFAVLEHRLERRLEMRLGDRFDAKFDAQFAKFFSMINRRLDKLEETKADRSQVKRLQTTMDGIANRLSHDDTERAFMSHQLTRHEGWIGELAKHTGAALSPP